MKRCRFAVVLAALLALGACDAAPVDPLDPRADLASLLSSDDAALAGTANLAMPGLLHAAVRKVYTEQGIAAARELVDELRRLNEQAQAAAADGDATAGTDELHRLHEEEIRIVLQVFGDALAGRVLDAVRADAALLESTVTGLESGGRSLPGARASLARIRGLLHQGAASARQGEAASALGAAGRAASELEGIRRALAEASRLPTVAVLYEDALARLRASDAYMAQRTLEKHGALERVARDAVQAGDRDRAHAALESVRRNQLQFVLSVLGPAAAERVVADVEQARRTAETDVARAGSIGRDVYRLDRMLEAARDLHSRAARALAQGDATTALDLGCHAANLVNAVRLAVPTP
jgi:hypothetical protein